MSDALARAYRTVSPEPTRAVEQPAALVEQGKEEESPRTSSHASWREALGDAWDEVGGVDEEEAPVDVDEQG
jgi:hypothetical protein